MGSFSVFSVGSFSGFISYDINSLLFQRAKGSCLKRFTLSKPPDRFRSPKVRTMKMHMMRKLKRKVKRKVKRKGMKERIQP